MSERTASQESEHQNNVLATGALLAALYRAQDVVPALQSVVVPIEGERNQLVVEFEFLESPYRITVERIDAPKTSGPRR